MQDLDYRIFPRRTAQEAAVLEWGNSAILTALDVSVAHFGPQTSDAALLEVETQPVLADPLDGVLTRKKKKKKRPDKEVDATTDNDTVEGEDDEDDSPILGPLDNADEVLGKAGLSEQHYLIGTMIEIPRAAITADKVAEQAEFFSFGTNDLTQTTMGLSRDDYTKFSAHYETLKIFSADPFGVLDQEGVGKLVDMAVKLGRKTRPDLEIGICGEHGGEPSSVEFCVKVGMNYVSCSPYRVPIARLAAAQARIAMAGGEGAEANRTK